MNEAGVQIPIGFTLDDAQQALRILEAEARRSGKNIQTATEQGAKGIEGVGGSLMAFTRQQRREAATARFFVNELAQIVPVGIEAKGALVQLGGALVGGGPWAIAIAGASVAVGYLVKTLLDQKAAAREAAVATIKAASDMTREIAAADESTRAFYQSFRAFAQTDEQKFVEGATAALRSRVEKLDLDVEVKTAELAAMKAADVEKDKVKELERELDVLGKLKIALDFKLGQEQSLAREAFPLLAAEKKSREDSKKAAEAAREAAKKTAAEQERIRAAAFAYAKKWHDAELDELRKATDAEGDLADRISKEKIQRQMDEATEILAIVAEMERKRQAIQQQAWNEMRQMGANAYRSFATAAVGQLGLVINSSRAYENAMRASGATTAKTADLSAAAFAAMAQSAIAALAEQALVEAAMEGARAIAAAARYDYASAAEHGYAAAAFAAVALVAGGGAYLIGQTRGMTAAERADVEAARQAQAGSGSSSGPREVGAEGGSRVTNTRETIIVIGDPFETPQETARRAARRIAEAKRLDMLARADA